jgi:Tfp pilus assembly protein PilO
MKELTAQQQDAVKAGGILAAILVAAVIVFQFYWAKPQIESLQAGIAKTKTEISELTQRIRDMDEMKKNLEAMREKQRLLELVAAKLPVSNSPEEFYKAFQEVLTATRVEYNEMSQQPLEERTVYTEIPYRISGRGRYHDFGQFLNMIEENPRRLMRIKTFTIENNDARPSVHPVTVRLATFKFNKKG